MIKKPYNIRNIPTKQINQCTTVIKTAHIFTTVCSLYFYVHLISKQRRNRNSNRNAKEITNAAEDKQCIAPVGFTNT